MPKFPENLLAPEIIILVISTTFFAGIAWNNVSAHEKRIATLETDNQTLTATVVRIDQRVTDLWKDNGHRP